MFTKIFHLVFYSLILWSCSSDTVTVTSFSPQGEIKELQNFTIEFSKDLAPADTINKWSDKRFVTFSPPISGKFKWTSPSTLVFSSDYSLNPIQEYQAVINKEVLFNKKYKTDFPVFSFNTPEFKVEKIEVFWKNVPRESYKLSVQANITFNYPVDPKKLKEQLQVKCDDETINDFTIVSTHASNIIAVNFGEMKQKEKEQSFYIVLKKDLISVFGKKSIGSDQTFETSLPSLNELALTDIQYGVEGQIGWIEVATSQMIDEQNIKNYISINPKTKFDVYVDESGFRIEIPLNNVKDIDLLIKKGLPGLYGGQLDFDFEEHITLTNMQPSLKFVDSKGLYLMKNGGQNLEVDICNIDEIEVEYTQIYDNNLLHFLNNNSFRSYNDYYYDNDYYEDESEEYNPRDYYYSNRYGYQVDNYGKVIFVEQIKLEDKQSLIKKYNLNIKNRLEKKFKGIYIITVRSNEERYLSDSKIVSLSNLGIISKIVEDEIIVFVNEINTTESVSSAKVKIISNNNQTMFEGYTDNSGVVRFKDKGRYEKFVPSLIIVEKNDDYNFLDLSRTKIETSRFDVGGSEYDNDYNVFLYGPRNLYRPGNEINISGIVRNERIKVVKDIPINIAVYTPSGKKYDVFKKVLDDQGAFDLNFTLPEFAQTGSYHANIYTGSDLYIGSYDFSVEDFVPEKIRVNVKCEKEKYLPGEKVKTDISAEYLFGAKASGLNYTAEIQFYHRDFNSNNFSDYSFGGATFTNSSTEPYFAEGVLDIDGKGSFEYLIPDDFLSKGFIQASAVINVFDPTGRTATRWVDFKIFTRDYFIGLKSSGYYNNVNESINYNIVAIDSKEQLIKKFNATAMLVRLEWQTVLKQNSSDSYYYDSEEKEVVEWEKNILINGKTPLNFKVSKSGKYELRISQSGSKDYHKSKFYAYGWSTSTSTSFEVDREGRIEIVADKKEYQPGETAKLLFTCPFSGKMLVTFERNRVLKHQYVEVKNKSAEIFVNINEDYMPNIYVTATLFKKHSPEQETPFLVGHGFSSVAVIRKSNKISVNISAPDKIKPNTTQTVTIKTTAQKNVHVTLAAVDEGILQINNYQTPDPFKFMYAKRPLAVNSYDLYKLLLPEIVKKSSSTGGDGFEELEKRSNPVTVKRFKLLAIWSGIKKTDGKGIVKIPISIPQFNGNIRLMVVAYSNSNFGSAEKSMLVADDIIIEPQVPRFLAPNDKLVTPVTIINNTDAEKEITLSMKLEGPIKSTSKNEQTIKIKPKTSGSVVFNIESTSQIGAAKISFIASGKVKAREDIDIAVRPISPLIVETDAGVIKANEKLTINIPKNFLKGTQTTSLTISNFPAIKFGKQLKQLIGYPHGCIEQTVSKLFPQLYFEDIAKLVAPELYKTTSPVYFVKEGIKKIESMQLEDGSITYWQGTSQSNWWGSVYAANFLIEAQKAKYNVSEDVLFSLLNFLSRKAKEPQTYTQTTYSDDGRTTLENIARKEILYSLYVMALAKKPDIATMNYYKLHRDLLSQDSRYLLAGAYALAGRWNSYYELLPKSYEPVHPQRETGGSFDSDLRSNAIMLNVLLEVDPGSKKIPLIIKYLLKNIHKSYSTQEQSFVFLALGKAAKNVSADGFYADVIVNGKSIAKYSNKDITLKDDQLNAAVVTIKSSGKGEVYYFWTSEGIKLNEKTKEEDSNLRIRREFYNYKTKALIADKNFTQGDLVICKISLFGMEQFAENIVITDMIPAGFEIENPRLNSKAEVNWKSNNPINIQYMDIRDDRLLLFTSAGSNVKYEFYYLLRAVNQGIFQLPIIGAEAMYDREFHSYNGAGIVSIKARK